MTTLCLDFLLIHILYGPLIIHTQSIFFLICFLFPPPFFPFNLFNPFKFKDLKSKYYKR